MLRKLGIVLAVVALGLTSIQTDAFARGGGGGGHGGGFGGGGHFAGGGFGGGAHFGGGGFGGGHFGSGGFAGGRIGGGFAGPRGFSGGHFGAPMMTGRAGLAHRGFHNRFAGRRLRGLGFGDWGWYCDDWPYYDNYGYYNYSCY